MTAAQDRAGAGPAGGRSGERTTAEGRHLRVRWSRSATATPDGGIGSALLRPVLEECDRTGTPAHLEASGQRNRVLYARHGCVARDPLPLPGGGPTIVPMWREPA